MESLKEKVVFITGASSGIGAETARHFARLGCKLALSGRNKDALQDVAKECEKLGCASQDVLTVIGDVNDENQMKEHVEKIISHFSKIDVLVNNAGTLATGFVQSTSLETWDCIINTNLRSVFHICKLLIPHLMKSKGCIVNVSSVNGLRPAPDVVAYSVSKAALDQLTQCLALELAEHGVRVNSVNPGITKTLLAARAGLTDAEYKRMMSYQANTHPLGRVAEPEDVAKAITWLSSEEASFMTGVLLPIDGGRTILPPPKDPNP